MERRQGRSSVSNSAAADDDDDEEEEGRNAAHLDCLWHQILQSASSYLL